MGRLEVMDVRAGDVKIEWSPANIPEVNAARKMFKELIGKGYKAFEMLKLGKKGEELTEFDEEAERILMVPPIAGG